LPNSGKSLDFCQIVESLKTLYYLDFVLCSMNQLLFLNFSLHRVSNMHLAMPGYKTLYPCKLVKPQVISIVGKVSNQAENFFFSRQNLDSMSD
jgi:hypothetical protein